MIAANSRVPLSDKFSSSICIDIKGLIDWSSRLDKVGIAISGRTVSRDNEILGTPDLHTDSICLVHQSLKNDHDGVVKTKSSQCSLMHNFSDIMRSSEMEHLRMQYVIHVEHHFCQQPVVGRVQWSVDQICANVCLDR